MRKPVDPERTTSEALSPAAARHPGGAGRSAALQTLQRRAGNRAVLALLSAPAAGGPRRRLQRFVDLPGAAYVVGAPNAQQEMFQSQGFSAVEGSYTRARTRVPAGGAGLETVREKWNPSPSAGPGSAPTGWQGVGGPTAAANPPIKVSDLGHVALEKAAQPKVFYIDDALVGGYNTQLGNAQAPVRIRTTDATIAIQAGAHPARGAGFTLRQASVVATAGAGGQVATVDDLRLATLKLDTECHNLAKAFLAGKDPVTGGTIGGRGGNRTAAPQQVGEAFHFKNRNPGSVASEREEFKFSAWFGTDFGTILAALARFDQLLADVDETYSFADASAHAAVDPKARAFLPGWSDHSEAALAIDGSDVVTLANYNRSSETSWFNTGVIRDLFRTNQTFQAEFKAAYGSIVEGWKQGVDFKDLRTDRISADLLAKLGGDFLSVLRPKLATTSALLNRAVDARKAGDQLGKELWYLSLYGQGAGQSFHEAFDAFGTRGAGGGQTTVV